MSHSIYLDTKIEINISKYDFKNLTISFFTAMVNLFEEFISQALIHYFEKLLSEGNLAKLLGVSKVTRKSCSNKTKFKTLFGDIWIPQIQVMVVRIDGRRSQMSITRTLLKVGLKLQIPDFMKDLMGWVGSLTTFRVGHKIIGAFTNFKCSLMSVWGSVQSYARKIDLNLSPDGTNEFEADGTGIPTKNSGKRGSELKKVFQKKKNGKLHLVGIAIGKYKNKKDWLSILSSPIKAGIEQFEKIILASDGDTSITDTAKSLHKNVKIQKDIWHVFHQLKYYLWQDKVPKEIRPNITKLIYKITMTLTNFSSEKRLHILDNIIKTLNANGCKSTVTYLQSAMN